MNASIDALQMPKSRVVIVANGENPPQAKELPKATVISYPTSEYCMSNWWNAGLDYAASKAKGKYEVFISNADTIVSGEVVEALAKALRTHDLAATGPDQADAVQGDIHIETRAEPFDLRYRLPGYAFMLRGELDLRADPQFRHWYLDDDLEWQARQAGGTGIVKGLKVYHPPGGNPLPPMLQQFAAEDREKFAAKWGTYPH